MTVRMTTVRWPGKLTSGRYVFRTRSGWYWQCDLHDDTEPDRLTCGDTVPTMQEAFAGALRHAALICKHVNK